MEPILPGRREYSDLLPRWSMCCPALAQYAVDLDLKIRGNLERMLFNKRCRFEEAREVLPNNEMEQRSWAIHIHGSDAHVGPPSAFVSQREQCRVISAHRVWTIIRG